MKRQGHSRGVHRRHAGSPVGLARSCRAADMAVRSLSRRDVVVGEDADAARRSGVVRDRDHGDLGAGDPALGAPRAVSRRAAAGAAWLMRWAGRSSTSTSAWRAGGLAVRGCATCGCRDTPPTCGCCSARWRSASGPGSRSLCGAQRERTRGMRASSSGPPCSCTALRPTSSGSARSSYSIRRSAPAAAVLLRRHADPGLAAVVALGLVPLAARALARGGGAARGDVHAARHRAAPGAAGRRPRADRDCEGRAAQAGDPPPCRPVRTCGDRVAGRRQRSDRRDQPDPRRAGLRRAGLLRAHLQGDRPGRGPPPGRLPRGRVARSTWRCSPGSRSGARCSSCCSASRWSSRCYSSIRASAHRGSSRRGDKKAPRLRGFPKARTVGIEPTTFGSGDRRSIP